MDNNTDIIIKRNGKDLTPEEINRLGITIYKSEKSKPKTFNEFASNLISLIESYDDSLNVADEIIDGPGLSMNRPDNTDLIDQLNKIYTPILITQELENSMSEQIMEDCSNESVLYERNIIKFDNDTRFAQLVSVCALLISRKKGTQEYKVFEEASKTKKKMKLRIQKMEHNEATELAKLYLDSIMKNSTTSGLRKIAGELNDVI